MDDTKKIIDEAQKRMLKSLEATKKEFQNLRTGRASIALVEGIQVEYYDSQTLLKGLASISTPDAKTILIQPWDVSAVGNIEKAILKSDIGLTPINDGKTIRIQIPPLTAERREDLSRVVRKLAEEGRVAVRNARHDSIEQIKKLEKSKAVAEDISHSQQKEVQKLTDKFISQIDESLKHKEAEIHAV